MTGDLIVGEWPMARFIPDTRIPNTEEDEVTSGIFDESKLPDDPVFRRELANATRQAEDIRARTGKALVLDLKGEDGNAYVILGMVRRIIIRTMGKEEASRYAERARAGNYEDLLAVSREYVEIIDMPTRVVYDIDDEEEYEDE